MNQKILYEEITNKIIEALENGSIPPWRRPWATSGNPRNPMSGTDYKGINILLLNLHQSSLDLKSNLYGTMLQWNSKKCKIKKGSKGCPIYFWNILKKDKLDSSGEVEGTTTFPLLKRFTAFNILQIEGEYAEKALQEQQAKLSKLTTFEINDKAELLLSASEAPIIYGGDEAAYNPSKDEIYLPERGAFTSIMSFYQTAFHELIHSTGTASRCDRVKKWHRFGSEAYAAEELVAEIGGRYLGNALGVEDAEIEKSSVSYLKNWLVKALKNDCRLIVQTSGAASVASDYCLAKAFADTPKKEILNAK